jgi:hypothetical protein
MSLTLTLTLTLTLILTLTPTPNPNPNRNPDPDPDPDQATLEDGLVSTVSIEDGLPPLKGTPALGTPASSGRLSPAATPTPPRRSPPTSRLTFVEGPLPGAHSRDAGEVQPSSGSELRLDGTEVRQEARPRGRPGRSSPEPLTNREELRRAQAGTRPHLGSVQPRGSASATPAVIQ